MRGGFVGWALAALLLVGAHANVLDDYVNEPDATYSWSLANTVAGDGYTIYVLRLISQTWLSLNEIDRPVWEHWLKICVPNTIDSDIAAIYLNGGGNPLGTPPSSMEQFLIDVSKRTNVIFAELNQIPNQPITFADEGVPRVEDAFLAKTWDDYIRYRDGYRVGRLPMVKASVRALDAMTEFVASRGLRAPQRFCVAGGSKRGWATWLTGAVDERVIGIAPIVIEILNMQKNINYLWQVYGRWPVAFGDYTALNLTRCLNCQAFDELALIEDPLTYLDRFRQRNVPILSVSATGDEFFLPDGYQFWYFDYTGEKYLAIQPNAEHSMFNKIEELSNSLGTFLWTLKYNLPRPRFTWTLSPDGSSIIVVTQTKPSLVRVWEAYNKRGRSFIANCYLTCLWRATELVERGNNTYIATYDIPTEGYRGFFVELQFDIDPTQPPLTVTTGTSFIPQALPFPPCGDACSACDSCQPLPESERAKVKRYQPR